MTRIALMVSLAVGLAAPESRPADPAEARKTARDDLKKFQGTWVIVAMENEGEVIQPDDFKGRTAVYDGDLLSLKAGDQVRKRGIIALDPSRSPKSINTWDLDGPYADRTVPGIYEIDGDTLKLCFARPGEDRPKEFTSKRGSGVLSFVYRRQKP